MTSIIECSRCEEERTELFHQLLIYCKQDDSEARPEELDDYWMEMNQDSGVWDRIVNGTDPNFYAVTVPKVEKVIVPPCFDGTSDEAIAVGWQEAEYGWLCPMCSVSKPETEQREPTAIHSIKELFDLLGKA